MKKYKYLIALVLCLTAMIYNLNGCVTQKQGETFIREDKPNKFPQSSQITFFGFKTEAINLIAIEEILHNFMKENPDITITYEGEKDSDYWIAFDKRAKNNVMDDIIMLDHDRYFSLYSENKLVDLSDLSSISNFNNLVSKQFINNDNSVYFLPTCITTYGLYVNYDLLKNNKQKIPENISEFTEVCDYFVSKGVTPIVCNNSNSIKALISGKAIYPVYQKKDYQKEIENFNNGILNFAETLRPGIEMIEMMINHKWIDCKSILSTNPISESIKDFASGKKPFMITESREFSKLDSLDLKFDYKVHPFPILDEGSILVMDIDTCIGISSNSENIEKSKKFVEYMTQKDIIWNYCNIQNYYTPLKDNRVLLNKVTKPLEEYFTNGKNVIISNYNFKFPLDSALMECTNQILNGMNTDNAVNLLSNTLTTHKK